MTLERTIYHFEQFKDHFSPLHILKFMIEKTVAPVLLLGGDDSVRGAKVLLYLLRHTIERLVGGNFELYFVRVALARQTLKHTSDGVTVERTSTRHRQLQIKHL